MNRKVSLKGVVLMFMVAISGVLLLSCGKGGNSSESISDEGLFGSAGAEFVDIFLNEPNEHKIREQIADEVESEMLKKYPNYEDMNFRASSEIQAELNQKYDEAWKKYDYPGLRMKWEKRLAELVQEMSAIEIPVKVEEGTPLKLLSPVKLKDFDQTIKDKKLVFGFAVESTDDIMSKLESPPMLLFMNAADSVIYTTSVGDKNVNISEHGLKKGTRMEYTSFNFALNENTIKEFFSAKYAMLTWNTFYVDDGKLGPVQVGMSYTDLPKSFPVLYDKFEYKKETIENEMDGDYEVESCTFYRHGQEYFRAELEDGKVTAIVLDKNSVGLYTKEGYRVGNDVISRLYSYLSSTKSGMFSTVVINESLEWENYYEGEVFVTVGRYTFYVPSDQTRTEFPKRKNDFESGAKFSRIVCK